MPVGHILSGWRERDLLLRNDRGIFTDVAQEAGLTEEAGSYTLHWDGQDERGKELASGVYLYRLRVGERMETRKLVLVR